MKELSFQRKWAKIFPQNKDKILQYWKKYRCFNKIIEECQINFVSNILDVGCGISSVLHFLPGQKWAYDPLLLHYAKFYKYPKDIHFITCELGKITEEIYDVVFCSNVLDHITDEKKALQNIYKVLKPHGYFILTINIFDEHKERDEAHPHCFTKHDIWDLIKKKFRILHMEENDWYGLKNYVQGKTDVYGKELILILQKM